jgi:hypothetical protein
MAVRITCINKDNGNHYNRHEAIEKLGWVDENDSTSKGRCTRLEMVKFLEEDGGSAYVSAGGKKAYLVVKISSFSNRKYVQTVADGRETNNLLELPECL